MKKFTYVLPRQDNIAVFKEIHKRRKFMSEARIREIAEELNTEDGRTPRQRSEEFVIQLDHLALMNKFHDDGWIDVGTFTEDGSQVICLQIRDGADMEIMDKVYCDAMLLAEAEDE